MAPHTILALYDGVSLALQAFVVAFLLFHDWVPLGRLNNLRAIQSQDPLGRRIFVTLLPAIPAALGLYFCARHFGRAYPGDLKIFLWITYGVLVFGMLRAWWIPYLLVPDPKRAARYQSMFHNTHTFLPVRNGIAPDTLHVSLHLALAAILVLLLARHAAFSLA